MPILFEIVECYKQKRKEDDDGGILIFACPHCQGPAVVEYRTDEEKKTVLQKAATLWNVGKVIKMEPGE